MSGPTKGGITVKVLSGRTAASLQRYRDAKEDKESALFAATRHCSLDAETQIAEWKAVRVEHGTQGRTRAARGKYETVDPDTGLHANGQRGTHVKFWDGKRYRKRLAGPNETPTHLYVAPEDLTPEKESEATHTIYAFGADMVNPENPEDVERAFLAVKTERDEHYPGLQESMWGERNGESGLFHVHVASNATVYRDFTLDGVDYRAGQKMAGDMRDVHRVRARFEQYLDAHPEYGFEQSLARVGTKEYEAAQRRDGQHAYWEAERAAREGRAPKESNQDRIRREVYEALQEPDVTDRASFVDEMQSRGIDVEETGLRRGKRGKGYDLRYRVHGAKQGVKGATLGPEYAHDAIDAQLARRAAGLDVEIPAGKQRVGEAKPLPLTAEHLSAEEQAELDELWASVYRMAQEERARQQEERQQAEHETGPQKPASRTVADDEPQQPGVDEPSGPGPQQPGNDGPQPDPPAPEPKPEPAAFRSGLRGVKAKGKHSEKIQPRIDGMAQLEEDYYGRLPDAGYESRVAKLGIGKHFLDHYGEHLEPETRQQLTWRTQARIAASAEYERGKEHHERSTKAREQYDQLRKTGERDDPTGWMHKPEAQELHQRISASTHRVTKANDRVVEVRNHLKDGRYEEAAAAAARHQAQDRKSREAMENYSAGIEHDDAPSASDRFSARVKAAQSRDDGSLGR
jgi:hypothetical protein